MSTDCNFRFFDCFQSCWQVVPVSIHDPSVSLSGIHLANSEMGPGSINTAGLSQLWAQVKLFLFDARDQPWAACLLGVCVLVLATCGLPCLGYYRVFAKEPT